MKTPFDGNQRQDPEPVQFQMSPGEELLLQIEGVDRSVNSTFVGLKPNTCLIVETPAGIGLVSRPLEGSRVTVLYLRGGEVHAFESILLGRVDSPFRVIFLDYPQVIERWSQRQENRVEAFLPAALFMETEEVAAALLNISLSGCRLSCPAPAAGSPRPRVGQRLEVSLNLASESGELVLPARVRNLEQMNGSLLTGLEFEELDSESCRLVADYMTTMTNAFGAGGLS